MSTIEQSPWAPPTNKQEKTPRQLLEERYGDAEHPDDIDDMVSIVDMADFGKETEPGEAKALTKGVEISVTRTNKEGLDSGWKVIDDTLTVTLPNGSEARAIVATKKENGELQQKTLLLETVLKNNPDLIVTPENEREEAAEDLAEEALELTGVDNPSEVDESARLYSRDERKAMREASRRLVDEDQAQPPDAVEPIVESTPEEETELQMNERFLREAMAEKNDLYAQLRQAKPNTYEYDSLENQIRQAKSDADEYAKKVAKLKGNTNWH